MSWYESIGCDPPSWKEDKFTIIVDCIMLLLSSVCLIITVYGTYRYIVDHAKLKKTNVIKPAKALYFGGLVFFVISSLTLLNAFIYDAMYLICPRFDDIEGPIYHAIYFVQIFCLWIILFLRIHYIFKNTDFDLSKFVIRFYLTLFSASLASVIPIYIMFQADADAFVTLPYVILSAVFSTAILFTFVRKLMQIFSKLGADELLLKTMVKHTILAISSISCTFLVIITLVILYVKHHGVHERRSVLEELILELFILIDIVSNFVCVLFSYSFFDKKFQLICGKVNNKLVELTSKKISSSMDHKGKSRDKTFTDFTVTTQTPHSHFTKVVTQSQMRSKTDIITMEPNNELDIIHDVSVGHEENDKIEQHLHEQTQTKPVASLILKLSNKLSKKKSNSRSNSQKKGVNNINDDILLTLMNDTIYKPSLQNVTSMTTVTEISNTNKIQLRPTRSQPVLNISTSK